MEVNSLRRCLTELDPMLVREELLRAYPGSKVTALPSGDLRLIVRFPAPEVPDAPPVSKHGLWPDAGRSKGPRRGPGFGIAAE